MAGKKTRRNFLAASVAVAGGIIGSAALKDSLTSAGTPTAGTMPERILGKTGVSIPILGLGGAGYPLGSRGDRRDEGKALAIIERAVELGIRYFDTASSYGPNEVYLGKVLPPHRANLFLASKTLKRDRDGAWKDLERSLKNLQTDRLDLWQIHSIAFDSALEQIFSPNGAIKALEEAQEQGIVKFSGITGHHEPEVIAEGLRRYPFDTTLICINAADKHHPRPFIPAVMPVARDRNVGVIAMKVPAYGRLFKPGILDGMGQAFGYALSQPGVHCAIIAAESVAQLEENAAVAGNFSPLGDAEMAAIERRTASAWEENTFFRAWT